MEQMNFLLYGNYLASKTLKLPEENMGKGHWFGQLDEGSG